MTLPQSPVHDLMLSIQAVRSPAWSRKKGRKTVVVWCGKSCAFHSNTRESKLMYHAAPLTSVQCNYHRLRFNGHFSAERGFAASSSVFFLRLSWKTIFGDKLRRFYCRPNVHPVTNSVNALKETAVIVQKKYSRCHHILHPFFKFTKDLSLHFLGTADALPLQIGCSSRQPTGNAKAQCTTSTTTSIYVC